LDAEFNDWRYGKASMVRALAKRENAVGFEISLQDARTTA
jgi:hypothetical protein